MIDCGESDNMKEISNFRHISIILSDSPQFQHTVRMDNHTFYSASKPVLCV